MRRVVAILLAVVLIPSLVIATWYRCTTDDIVRSTCCCSAEHSPDPAPDPGIKNACCCETIQVASTSSHEQVVSHAASIPLIAVEAPVVSDVAPAREPVRIADRARTRQSAAPPQPLFVYNCSLLL